MSAQLWADYEKNSQRRATTSSPSKLPATNGNPTNGNARGPPSYHSQPFAGNEDYWEKDHYDKSMEADGNGQGSSSRTPLMIYQPRSTPRTSSASNGKDKATPGAGPSSSSRQPSQRLAHLTPPQRRFIRMIEHSFNRHLCPSTPPSDDANNRYEIDIPLPAPYSGSPDEEEYTTWALNMIRWFAVKRLFGGILSSGEVNRDFILGQCLDGDAKRWFHFEVANPLGELYGVTSLEVLCELHLRFIPRWAHMEARREFEAATYEDFDLHKDSSSTISPGTASTSGGAVGLMLKLKSLSTRLYKPVLEQDIQRRFISALPGEIVDIIQANDPDLLVVNGSFTCADLLRAVQVAECSIRDKQLYADLNDNASLPARTPPPKHTSLVPMSQTTTSRTMKRLSAGVPTIATTRSPSRRSQPTPALGRSHSAGVASPAKF